MILIWIDLGDSRNLRIPDIEVLTDQVQAKLCGLLDHKILRIYLLVLRE